MKLRTRVLRSTEELCEVLHCGYLDSWSTWHTRVCGWWTSSRSMCTLQGEGGQDVLLTRGAFIPRRRAEIRLPVGADVVFVVVVVVMQGVEKRGWGVLTPGGQRTLLEPELWFVWRAHLWLARRSPDLILQNFELLLQLLVGLLLLVQVSLQLLLAVLQSVNLFLSLVHVPLQGLQTQIQLQGETSHTSSRPKHTFTYWNYWMNIEDKCENVITYLVLLILHGVVFFFTLHRHLFHLPLQPAVHQLQVGSLPETQHAVNTLNKTWSWSWWRRPEV